MEHERSGVKVRSGLQGWTRRTAFFTRGSAARTIQHAARRKIGAGGNKAVARKLSQRGLARTARNTDSIVTLAKQVKDLQRVQMGAFQKEWQHCKAGHGLPRLQNDQPACFALNDFTPSSGTFIGTQSTTTPPHNFFAIDTLWADTVPFGGGTNEKDYSYWYNDNKEHASKKGYRAISTTVTVNMEQVDLAPTAVVWFRIDIVKPTKQLLPTALHKLSLPTNIQGLARLADKDMEKRNRINRGFFNVIESKWYKMENTQTVNKTIEKFATFHVKFPRQKAVEDMDAHGTVSTSEGDLTQTFITNVPQDQIYWMIISTSNSGVGSKVQLSRYISYRDNQTE